MCVLGIGVLQYYYYEHIRMRGMHGAVTCSLVIRCMQLSCTELVIIILFTQLFQYLYTSAA